MSRRCSRTRVCANHPNDLREDLRRLARIRVLSDEFRNQWGRHFAAVRPAHHFAAFRTIYTKDRATPTPSNRLFPRIVWLEQLEALIREIGFLDEHHHATEDANTQLPRHRPVFLLASDHRPRMNGTIGIKSHLHESFAKLGNCSRNVIRLVMEDHAKKIAGGMQV